jgi:glycosylphosphatidylinositol transamidase (GPIT) subunit GPI8
MPEIAADAAIFVDPYKISEVHSGLQIIINDSNKNSVLIKNGFKNVKRFIPPILALEYSKLYT